MKHAEVISAEITKYVCHTGVAAVQAAVAVAESSADKKRAVTQAADLRETAEPDSRRETGKRAQQQQGDRQEKEDGMVESVRSI
jgi:hypothetical protein